MATRQRYEQPQPKEPAPAKDVPRMTPKSDPPPVKDYRKREKKEEVVKPAPPRRTPAAPPPVVKVTRKR